MSLNSTCPLYNSVRHVIQMCINSNSNGCNYCARDVHPPTPLNVILAFLRLEINSIRRYYSSIIYDKLYCAYTCIYPVLCVLFALLACNLMLGFIYQQLKLHVQFSLCLKSAHGSFYRTVQLILKSLPVVWQY